MNGLRAATAPEGSPLRRLVGAARPYIGLFVAVAVCTLIFSAGRYGRAYLTKPLLDGVLLPVAESGLPTESGVPRDGLAGFVASWLVQPTPESSPVTNGPPPTEPMPTARPEDAPDVVAVFTWLIWAALVIVLVTPLALFGRAYLAEYAVARMTVDLKRAMASKLLRLPMASHLESRTGDVLARALNDTDAAAGALALIFQEFLLGTTMVVLGVSTLLYISWPLTLVSLLAAPPLVLLVSGFGRRIERSAARRQTQLGEVTQRLLSILDGISVIKAFGAEAAEERAFERETARLLRRDMRVVGHRVLSRSLVEALNSAAGIIMLMLGTALVLHGRFGLTTGDIAAFATVLATTYKPIKNLSRAHGRLMERLASARRYFEVLDAEEEPADSVDAVPIPDGPASVCFEDVHFGHAMDDARTRHEVLEGVDFELHPGEVVALVGASGAGKSTAIDLLLRLYDVDRGSIRVGGIDVREAQRASLRASVALVSQEAFLFDASIEDNVRYGRPDASQAEFERATKAARVDEFARDLPDGYATPVGEFGLRLSGGQRQRIAMARALLRDARIFVFDEATSALDVETERLVQDAIDVLRGDRVIWVVAHRASTLRRADRVLLLEGGRIVEDGPISEIAARSARFRELVGSDLGAGASIRDTAPIRGSGAGRRS